MSDNGVKIGIKADTGIMLLKPSTVSLPTELKEISTNTVSSAVMNILLSL